MALNKKIKTDYGTDVDKAYHRVESVKLFSKNEIGFTLNAYADITKKPISNNFIVCDYDLNGENPIKQAYLHLKTLPEFADAVDC